ncbi:MAG: SUMF1/EgtB/PvdO family nonheme iron enzyme [Longimonas sp.]|uniref:formylglycine-generating enzyme family protein n=1 Tax=Longimonas sp. TaxID=2039626 RepID=UPI003354CCA9
MPTDALSQRLFVSGGTLLSQETGLSELDGTNPAISGGFMLDLNSVARLRGGLTYQELTSADVGVEFHVLGSDSPVSPYIYAGYGRFIFGEETERALFPLGLGLDYAIGRDVSLKAEVAGRWAWTEEISGGTVQPELVASFMPTLGVVYRLNRIDREVPARGVRDDRDALAEASAAECGPFGYCPSDDELAVSDLEFDIPYTKQELVASGSPLTLPRTVEVARFYGEFGDPGRLPYDREVDPDEDIFEFDDHSDMVRLPSGTFLMGPTDPRSDLDQDPGRLRISMSGFFMDQNMVTNADYQRFLDDLTGEELQSNELNLPDAEAERYFEREPDSPVLHVTWDQADAYCEWRGHSLPTEAQWEYAARGGVLGAAYPWPGLSAERRGQPLANFNSSNPDPVGSYEPNRWGLFDMAGNAYEWTADAWTRDYGRHAERNPRHTNPREDQRAIRGGSWRSGEFEIGVGVRERAPRDIPLERVRDETSIGGDEISFRCAATLSQIDIDAFEEEEVEAPPEADAPDVGTDEENDIDLEFPEP